MRRFAVSKTSRIVGNSRAEPEPRDLDRESFNRAETKSFDCAVIDREPDAKSNGSS